MEIKTIEGNQHCPQWRLPLYDVYVYMHPTYNCQLFVIGNVQSILGRDKSLQLEMLTLIANTVKKPRMLVDIHESKSSEFEELFKAEQIIIKAPYISSNSSKMVLYQVDVRHLYL